MYTVYYEGDFIPETEASIPISDRGFQFGDGAYATLQVRDGIPLFLEEHLTQLREQCCSFNLAMPAIKQEAIDVLIHSNGALKGIWRMKILITGGDHPEMGLPLREGRSLILLKPFTPQPFKTLNLGIFPIPYTSCHASFKSLAHLNRFYVMEEANRQGVDDCVTLTESGCLLEAAFGNLFWIKGKTLFTPDPTLPLYFGVTIKKAIELAQDAGFEIEYVRATLAELPLKSVAFRTNTMQGIRPIGQIGIIPFEHNPFLQTLFVEGYEEIIRQEKQNYTLRNPIDLVSR